MKRILLLILALVLTLALMACRSKEPEDTADAVDNSTLSNSAQLSMTEASYLEYDNGQITCRFRKDEDGWKWVDNEAFPLDAAYIEETLAELDAMSASLTPVEPAVEAADAGLDDTQRYLTVTVGEETTTLRFGDQQDDQWYMAVDGQEDTYLVADEFVQRMNSSVYSMAVLPTLPELTEDNLTVITVRGSGEGQTVRMSKTDEGWICENRMVPEKAAEVEAALADFTFDSCFNFDPSPDAAPLCGLTAPTATVTVAYVNTVGTETTLILTLGDLREDGSYYATLNDDTTVYLVSQDKVAAFLALL